MNMLKFLCRTKTSAELEKEIASVLEQLGKLGLQRHGLEKVETREELDILVKGKHPIQIYRMGEALHSSVEEFERRECNRTPNLPLKTRAYVQKQQQIVANLWKRSMQMGYKNAKYSLAKYIEDGKGDFNKSNEAVAVKYYKELADEKHAWGTYAYGDALFTGKGGLQVDKEKGFIAYQQAAKSKVPPAAFKLGNLFELGEGVQQDDSRALMWYNKAAEAGDPMAYSKLGELHFNGKCGLNIDKVRGFEYYKMAADTPRVNTSSGAGVLVAIHNVGLSYLVGDGVQKDPQLAASYFLKAAQNGFVLSMVNLGLLHRDGIGIPQNKKLALSWFRMASKVDSSAKQLLCELEQEQSRSKNS